MRPLEFVLVVFNFLALGIRFVPRLRAASPARIFLPCIPLAAVAQAAIEGIRWQMIPSYALAGAIGVGWFLALPGRRTPQRGRAAGIARAAAGFLAFTLSSALPLALPVFHFPPPRGPYAIGTATYHWVDSGRPELFSKASDGPRELTAQVWYPAAPGRSGVRAPYVEDAGVVTPALARLLHLPPFVFSYLRYVRTNAIEDAPVAKAERGYPVLIYLTGLGGFRSANMFQIQALVSRGYVVVGLDQPGGASAVLSSDGEVISALPRAEIQPLIDQSISPEPIAPTLYGRRLPDGIIPYLAEDVSFTIDRLASLDHPAGFDRPAAGDILAGRMDLRSIGVFGISLGAMVAAEAAFMDPRIGAVLMMDAAMPANVVAAGLHQPAMWMTRPARTMRLERERAGGWSERDIAETLSTMREVFNESQPGSGYYLDMPGVFHVNFTDAPLWFPLGSQLGLTGPVNGARTFEVINAYSIAFFGRYLKGLQEPLLDGQSIRFPGVHLKVSRR